MQASSLEMSLPYEPSVQLSFGWLVSLSVFVSYFLKSLYLSYLLMGGWVFGRGSVTIFLYTITSFDHKLSTYELAKAFFHIKPKKMSFK